MAVEVQRMIATLEANFNKYDRALNKALGNTDRTFRRIETRGKAMERRLSAIAPNFRGLLATFGVGISGREFLQLADAATRVENSLKVAGLAGAELTRVYDELYDSAQRNAAPLESLVDLYGRAAQVQKELGVTSKELLGFTDNVAVALRVSGKSASEASGALLQLSQALGSGTVRAEEFNSILEGALPIAQAAAAGLEEAGGSVAKLRQLVVEGKVSSEAFFRAFEAGSVILQEKVANAELTVSQRFVRLRNVMIDAAGKFDDVLGISAKVGEGLESLAGSAQQAGDYFERNKPRIVGFFDSIGAAWAKLEQFKERFRSAIGRDVIDDFLAGTSLIEGRIGRLSDWQAQFERRVDDAWGGNPQRLNRTGRGDRIGSTDAVKTVSLADFGLPGAGSVEEFRTGTAAISERADAIDEVDIATQSAADSSAMLADIGRDVLGGMIEDLREGKSAADTFASAVDRLADRFLDMALNAIFPTIGGAGVGFGGGGLFGGFRAKGGSVSPGKIYGVGEKGPELFVPGVSGTIVPSHALAKSGSAAPIINIVNKSGGEVSTSRRQSGGVSITDIVIGSVNQGLTGGKFNKAMASQFGARAMARQR